MVDAEDSKSSVARRAGSSPAGGTTFTPLLFSCHHPEQLFSLREASVSLGPSLWQDKIGRAYQLIRKLPENETRMSLEDLYRSLRSGHVELEGIVAGVAEPLVVLDHNLCVVTANPAFFQAFSAETDDTIGRSMFELGNGQWNIPELRSLLMEVVPKSAAIIGFEVSRNFPQIGHRVMLVSARRLRHPEQDNNQILVVFEDVTKREQELVARDLLLSEARHRIKNLMSVVQSLAIQTTAKGKTGEEYRDAFLGRFQALVDAQDLTLGHVTDIDLATICRRVLQISQSDRMDMQAGPEIKLKSQKVFPLAMILHELTTNAIKFGALSGEKGRLHFSWSLEPEAVGRRLVLNWREEGGPPVAPPQRKGLGTEMIEFSAISMMGAADLQYHPSGLHARVVLPID
jgi:two-component sensor histidine kinase